VSISVKKATTSKVPATTFTSRVALPNADSVPQPSTSP
jgi:hypothetical protein